MKLAVREYLSKNGKNHFRAWLSSLDLAARARIQARALRFETGNLGDSKPVGKGIWEGRFFFGGGVSPVFRKGRSNVDSAAARWR